MSLVVSGVTKSLLCVGLYNHCCERGYKVTGVSGVIKSLL